MTMRVVLEAVELQSRAQLYGQHDLVWTRGDNLHPFLQGDKMTFLFLAESKRAYVLAARAC